MADSKSISLVKASEDDAKMKLSYELFYVLNRSFTFYLTILLETLKVLIFRRGGR